MKILFISRATLFQDKGGDTIQVLNTATGLKQLGVDVTIRLCNEKIDYSRYTLIHFFNIIRPADILYHIQQSGKPYVISTIYVDYTEYEKKMRMGLTGFIFKLFSSDFIEYLKVFARFIVNGEKIISTSYILMGQKKSIRQIIQQAKMLLPNSHNEYQRLVRHYKVDQNYKKIPNAIDPTLFTFPEESGIRNDKHVICVGRIEGRKNQLNLIRALNNTSFKLTILGSPSPNQVKYFEKCKKEAATNISFVNNIPQDLLINYYRIAKVHVLPSWFETTGLSTLEAAAMGCNIVITRKGDTEEYFEDYAFYCEPDSPESIFKAIQKASSEKYNEVLRNKIFTEYIWTEAANKTFQAYEEILNKE